MCYSVSEQMFLIFVDTLDNVSGEYTVEFLTISSEQFSLDKPEKSGCCKVRCDVYLQQFEPDNKQYIVVFS